MRIGLALTPDARLDDFAKLAREAEEMGFADLWMPDHYFFRDVYSFLTLAATHTKNMRLGAAVASPYLRHPALLASTVATLDEISDGRAIYGIGPGGFEFATQLGTPIEKPRTATIEAIQIARSLWSGAPTTVKGEAFNTSNAQLQFSCTRSVPVYMAARGPRMLETAGTHAEGLITHGISDAHVRFVQEHAHKGATSAGRARPSVVLMLGCVVDSLAAAYDKLRPTCIAMAGGTYADNLIPVYGLDQQSVKSLRSALHSGDWGEAARRVTDEMIDAFCLAGPPERCRDGLERLTELGVDEIIISTGAFTGPTELREGVAKIAEALRLEQSGAADNASNHRSDVSGGVS